MLRRLTMKSPTTTKLTVKRFNLDDFFGLPMNKRSESATKQQYSRFRYFETGNKIELAIKLQSKLKMSKIAIPNFCRRSRSLCNSNICYWGFTAEHTALRRTGNSQVIVAESTEISTTSCECASQGLWCAEATATNGSNQSYINGSHHPLEAMEPGRVDESKMMSLFAEGRG